MAISKERLEELIKEGATIYSIKHNGGDVVELSLKNISDEFWYFLLGMTDELFENKAEVEEKSKKIKWALKYHATRTEELELPMWEEWQRVNKIGMYAMSFRDKKYAYCELMVFPDEIKVTRQAYGLEVLFDELATEENYIKACDLCLKLFEGEE